MSQKNDWELLLEFASEIDDIDVYADIDENIGFNQLHCLWVAYCIKYDQEPDTYAYDNGVKELFSVLLEKNPKVFSWEPTATQSPPSICFDKFDWFLVQHLV